MHDRLSLYIPAPDELRFYQKMLADPATMSYNAPWFPPDGCIDFPESDWAGWHANWVGREPERFYAYLRRESDGVFVGDVNYHHVSERGWWDIGILVCAPERGKGYGKAGLELLLERAFRIDGVARLHNEFESERASAYHIHRALGFKVIERENNQIRLLLTKEDYDAR